MCLLKISLRRIKCNDGTTIIESLVVILLLGILVTLTASFFTEIFNNKQMLRGEALELANQEMERTLSQQSVNDTSYFNEKGNLRVIREVNEENDYYIAEIAVCRSGTDSVLIILATNYIK